MPPTRLNKPEPMITKNQSTSSCRARNDEKWNIHKENIKRVYIDQDKTLRETMQLIQLTASERKWKEKLKEWGFQKNLPARDMAILISKRDKRLRDYGKDTIFFRDTVEIKVEKLENFKRRKTTHQVHPTSPSARTPPNIVYNTPREEPDTPETAIVCNDDSTSNNDSIPTSTCSQSKDSVPEADTQENLKFSGQSHALPFSQGPRENTPAATQTDLTRIANGLREPPNELLPTFTFLPGSPGYTNFLHPETLEPDQTSGPQTDSGISLKRTQASYETPRHKIQASCLTSNNSTHTLEVSTVVQPYRPVALISSTSVLAPATLGVDRPFYFSERNGHGLSQIEHTSSNVDSIETHMSLAQDYGAYGFTTLAENEYMTAIMKCLESGKENRVRLCLHEISMFFKQDRTPEELDHSIMTCRKLVDLFGANLLSTKATEISSLVMLADLLKRDGQLTEAASVYQKALDLTVLPEDSNVQRICEDSLGKIQYRLWSPNEETVREQLHKISTLLDQETLMDFLPAALDTLKTLASRFSSTFFQHPCYQLKCVIEKMSDLFAKQIQGRSSRFEIRVCSLTMELAIECVGLGWHDNAEGLFSCHRDLLDKLATADWGYSKILGYIDCCVLFQQRRDWAKSLEMITTAYKTMEDLIYSRNVQLYRSADVPLLKRLRTIRAAIPAVDCSETSMKIVEGMETRLEKMIAWNKVSCSGLVRRNGGSGEVREEKTQEENDSSENKNEQDGGNSSEEEIL